MKTPFNVILPMDKKSTTQIYGRELLPSPTGVYITTKEGIVNTTNSAHVAWSVVLFNGKTYVQSTAYFMMIPCDIIKVQNKNSVIKKSLNAITSAIKKHLLGKNKVHPDMFITEL